MTSAEGSLSTRLLEAAGEAWTRALSMRFVEDATAGALPEPVLARYLVLEREFVDTACRSLGAAILRAPTSFAIHGFGRTLASFLIDQGEYFEQAQETGMSAAVGPDARAQAEQLGRRVVEICERGTYAEVVCCMLPSERLYEAWCTAAAKTDAVRSPVLQEWIVSHSESPYSDTVGFLTNEVDRLSIDPAQLRHLSSIVKEILELERLFHDAAYTAT